MGHLAQQASCYRVEVSGWDTAHTFFSEKTMLYSSFAEQEIPLRSHLRPGMVIFVRILQPLGAEEGFPAPYVVAKNLPVEIDGRATVAIAKLHPKPSYRQTAASVEDPRVNCA